MENRYINSCYCNNYNNYDNSQRHDHEIQGTVEIAERREDPHTHHFVTVSGQAIPVGNGDHIHEVEFRTDFYEEHFHVFRGKSSGMIPVGDGRHVHYAKARTSYNDGHSHEFRVAVMIENPIGKKY